MTKFFVSTALLVLGLGMFLGAAVLGAQEAVSLTTPIVKVSTNSCHLSYMTLDVDNLRIQTILLCNNGDTVTKIYDATTTPTGASLLHSINVGNFSGATSFIKAIYNRLIADAVVSGSVNGVPQ